MKSPRLSRKPARLAWGAALLPLLASLQAETPGVWINSTGGDWDTTANWQAGQVANGVGHVANFSTLNISGLRTVWLASPVTLGGFTVNDALDGTHSWIFSPTADSGATLTLATGNGTTPHFAAGANLQSPRYARLRVPLAGDQGWVKRDGLGTLWLDADNSGLSGGVRVEQGALRVSHPAALGANTLTLQVSGTANVNTNWVRLELDADRTVTTAPVALTIANPIQIGPFIGPNAAAIAAVDTEPNRVTTLSGPITVVGAGGAGGLLAGPTATGSRLDVTGAVQTGDLSSISLTQTIDRGHVRLSGGGNIGTWRNNGYLSLGADEGLSSAGVVSVHNAYARPATLDLAGHDLTLTTLLRSNRSAVVNTAGGPASVLTINTPEPGFNYSDTLAGNISLVKRGPGTFTLGTSVTNLNNVFATKASKVVTLLDGDTLGLAVGQPLVGAAVSMTTTEQSRTAVVTNAVGLKVGMSVTGPNVAANTTITAISGTTLTLSANATTSGSVVTHNFSAFPAGAKIDAITSLTSFEASTGALVNSLEQVGGEDIVTSFGFQLTSHHAYTGRTVLNGGTFSISTISHPALPSGLGMVPTVDPSFLVFEGGELRYTGGDTATNRGFTVADDVSANINVAVSTTNLTIGGNSPASTGGLKKSGPGRLTMTGTYSFTGAIDASAGTLVLRDGGSFTPTSTVTVRNAATFIGTGSVGGVVVEAGGTLEIGPRPSGTGSSSFTAPTLTATALTLNPGAKLEFEFAGGSLHDRIKVTGEGALDLRGGTLYAYQNGSITNALAAVGEYPIISYAGAFDASALEDVVFPLSASGYTYRLIDKPLAKEVALLVATIGTRTWSATGGGSWTDAANWIGGSPLAFGQAPIFGSAISADSTVTLDTAATVSGLTFQSTRAYTLGGSGSLTLDAGAGRVDVGLVGSASHHVVGLPVNVAGPLRVSTLANGSLTFTGPITSGRDAIFTGTGVAVLGGTTDFSSISVEGGTLQIGAGGASGSAGSAEITLATNAKLSIKRSDEFTFTNTVKGSGGTLVHDGSGTTTLGGSGHSYTTLQLRAGTVRLASSEAVPSLAGVMSASLVMDKTGAGTEASPLVQGRLDLNGSDLVLGGSLAGTGGILTDLSGAAGVSTFTYDSGANSTYAGALLDGSVRSVGLTKRRTSTLTLTGESNYSGGTLIENGTINAMTSTAFGTGPVQVGMIGTGGGGNYTRLAIGNATVANALNVGAHFPNGGALLGLASGVSQSGVWSGPITITQASTNGYTFYGASGARQLVLSGRIHAPGLTLISGEAVKIANPNGDSDFGVLEHRRGTLTLGASGALPANLRLALSAANAATFNLAGYDQTLEQVVRASASYTATVTNTDSASLSTLTLRPASAFIYTGVFTGNLSVVKPAGYGDMTLTGASTHTNAVPLSGQEGDVSGIFAWSWSVKSLLTI